MRPAAVIAVFLLLFSLHTTAQDSESKKEELPHPKTLEELQSAMKAVIEKHHVPGAGVALVSKGEVLWCGGVGKANLAENKDVTCDTEFRVGSVSKSFVSLMLLKLEEEGKIDLNARLQDVAPEVPMKNRWAATNPVRITNLLEHSAGFDDMELDEAYNDKGPADMPLLNVLKDHPDPQDVRWPPSTRFSYSNPGYGIAGYLIEKVTSRTYDSYILNNLLKPLGFTVGDFPLTDGNRALLAQGYKGNPPVAVPYRNIYLRPAGDLKASPAELAKLVQFFLRRGTINGAAWIRPEKIVRMEYPATTLASQNGMRLGYGLANYTEVAGGVVTHGHDGGIDGFISTYRYMPEQNWGYVVLLNSTVSGKALEELNELAIDFLSKDFPKAQRPAVNLSAEELAQYAGYYTPLSPRNQLFAFLESLTGGVQVRVLNGQLTRAAMFGGKPEPLIPVGKNLFRTEKDPEATAAFFPAADGKMAYSTVGIEGMGYGERVSPLWTYTKLALLVLSVALLVSSILFALVWGLRRLFGGLKDVKHWRVRVVPLLASLAFFATLFGFLKSMETIGEFSVWPVLVYTGTLFFPLLTLIALWYTWRAPGGEVSKGVRAHSLLVALACGVLTIFLVSWHLIGLRLWT